MFFGLEEEDSVKSLYPIHRSRNKDRKYRIDLLYITR